MINVAIMGHGVVGSGVAEILLKHADSIAEKAKEQINIKYILDIREFPGLSYSDKFIKDFNIILNDDSIRVVAEVMGGVNPAYDFVKSCLLNGKSVVTSNKELVAAKGAELLKIAQDKNVNFLFEASVGGGIPVIRPMAQCMVANEITEIFGILNGTTNFILTKMIKENLTFDTALKIAQDLGYAERNPDADILGHDACRKICILAALGFGKHVYPEQVETMGITEITLEDIDYADKLGYVIKLIGHAAKVDNESISVAVHPALIERGNPLSSVNDVYNAIVVKGDSTQDVMFYGRGAGKLPTASAVVADIVDCVKHLNARKYLFWDDCKENYIVDPKTVVTKYYVHLCDCDNNSNIVDEIKSLFGKNIELLNNAISKEVVFITDSDVSANLKEKINSLKGCTVKSVIHTV